MKFYAVHWSWSGADTEEHMTEWFTTKTEAIARAKEVAIEHDGFIYAGVNVYKAEAPTTKKALLQWLNDCSGVSHVPENNVIWEGE